MPNPRRHALLPACLQGIDKMSLPWVEGLTAANASVAEALRSAIANARSVLEPFVEAAPDGGKTYAPYSTVDVPTRRTIQLAFYSVADALTEVRCGTPDGAGT